MRKDETAGPLAGVKVVDITAVFMGPSATQMLADLGADVIKVESKGGDSTRGIGPCGGQKMGPLFLGLNRNKRSIVLDLKAPAGLEALLRLVKDADLLAYNVRPRAMKRLGLDYESLAKINPRLVYVGMFGFSQRGRYAPQAAFDDLIQAATALPLAVSMGSGDIPRYLPLTIADRSVGLYAFGVICAALYSQARTGKGQRVDVPMFETMVPYVMGDHLYGETFIPAKDGFGYPRLLSRERRPYKTKDGHVCCLIYHDHHWRAFLKVIGKPDLYDADPRFATITTRTAHITDLYSMVSDELAKRTTDEWRTALRDADIPVFPMHTFESLLEDPHLKDVGFFTESDHPAVGRIREMAVPSEWHGTPPQMRRHAPRLGEHSRDVLREAGYDDAAIDVMMASGVSTEAGAA
ncbi:crotonobetainyl-CoA:carnitine CoA-transferase CaiB-like acyl-CoA transferase [Bradyrhizobium sp. USDA 4524]|uniref:CaiB/BaiF CoA transferase family protein n=1 Tax=unclassified Bradyrhizobium TaxID=2631580 RepID=UPI0020A10EED|nr:MULTISPECIES: CoA transferase [unclassified Bradyrhizobium]MCP1845910.1 crotonobetainyl-CoA:carnitine CoA-transferase CaiB-like acyl-CoA transferase [Bradyrhizobium sp. USDA 4538]MCP1907456.1 crotonobetainyl-CoA:carnitine CoA-transferase CaiB-like acyl-CoA transferase [Bradyrhizobium sp. USDA 4537]MCP1985242.1 crotonobetainyl-CoA:carnitine CoA-transferase CaiB-like acyl-CoA transferase [Bradyrhizobium sp. USDA 4539]